MLGRIAVLAPVLAFATPALAGGEDTIVGILESLSPGSAAELQRSYGTTVSAEVRVAFAKRDGKWVAYRSDVGDLEELNAARRSFPESVTWTITFDGKSRGRLESALPDRWLYYAHIGVQLIRPNSAVPRFGKPTADFEPFGADTPVYRPVVLVSQPQASQLQTSQLQTSQLQTSQLRVHDPQKWKPAKLGNGDLRRVLADFRRQVRTESSGVEFSDGDVRPDKVYRSAAGEVLFALAIRGPKPPADGPPGPAWSPHWFVANGAEPIRFLGSEMALIDAGDYDNDGQSEVVFLKVSYNFTGYMLFFDDFRQSVEFGWSYH
jgi:hypothetical protein